MAQNPTTVNTGGGDYAGRDMYKTIMNPIPVPTDKFRIIYNKFIEDCEKEPDKKEVANKLRHLMTQNPNDVIIGLQAKLKSAHKSDEEIEYALEVKEDYAKKLTKYQFVESSQNLHIMLLTTARSQFQQFVYPLIVRGEPDQIIQAALRAYVINHLSQMLDVDAKCVFDAEDIWGILYYLTGNCYIKWA